MSDDAGQDRNDVNDGTAADGRGDGADQTPRDEKSGHALDLVKTPFYAWIGAGVRTVEILGDIGARVRAEEEARDGSPVDGGDPLDDGAGDATGGVADSVAGRVRDARQRVRDLGDNVGEQSRDAFLKALEAAQLAFNDALTKAQAGGDRAFASAHTLPEDVASRAEQLKPEQLRVVADGYLEAASKIYRELAARGEQAVDEGVHVAKERGGSFDFAAGFPGAKTGAASGAEGADGSAADKGARVTDPVSALLGKLPFAGAAASRVTGSLEDAARETVKPLQDAGAEFLGRIDQEGLSSRVESILHQAADVTEQLLGALRAEDGAGAGADAAPTATAATGDVVDGEVVDEAAPAGAPDAAADVSGVATDVDASATAADEPAHAEETIADATNTDATNTDTDTDGEGTDAR